jgi:hypothetical protein
MRGSAPVRTRGVTVGELAELIVGTHANLEVTMRASYWMVLAGAMVVSACGEQGVPATLAEESEVRSMEGSVQDRRLSMERIARRVALAMADPEFRAYIRGSLDRSTFRERKLPFTRFLSAEADRAGLALAAVENGSPSAVAADLRAAGALEFYFPVPAHRERWEGGEEVLVATAVHDHEAPVAFDTRGRRIVLDPETPPSTPVLAVVPVETDFDDPGALQRAECLDCDVPPSGEGGGGKPNTGSDTPSLRLTYFNANKDFEGWLKGKPEYEIHVLAPRSQTDTINYRTLYCIGENAGNRYWNNDDQTWRGDVVLMTWTEMQGFHYAFPASNYSVMALEDDDGACVIKVDRDLMGNFLGSLSTFTRDYKAARDEPGVGGRELEAGKSGFDLFVSLGDLIQTNDEIVGIAVANSVTGYAHAEAEWAWIGGGSTLTRNGWAGLVLR